MEVPPQKGSAYQADGKYRTPRGTVASEPEAPLKQKMDWLPQHVENYHKIVTKLSQ